MIYTLDTEGTQEMINKAMTKRKTKLEQSQALLIEKKPEFAEALKNCNNFSSKKNFPQLLLQPQKGEMLTC